MHIIGLSGYARSGKDEAAKILVEEYGYIRVAFADKLREVLYALNPFVVVGQWDKIEDVDLLLDSPTCSQGVKVQDVIDKYGWDGYKETPYGSEIRRLLQRLGTEAGREVLGDNIWIDAALTGFNDNAKIVVTDARFENEAQAIKDRGGYMVRVTRHKVGPALSADGTAHASETSLDNWNFDWRLQNQWSLEQYHTDVRYMAERNWT